ncbi:MAG TPA: UDP-2,4-diacetamido-2,4,6-trideoxy-beta-L-altropyranose hydrolase [Moraxellaceae bacterium]
MSVVFRTDASARIGSGHVMRCLTLATALRATGAQCRFICRAHSGHLAAVIRQQGFACDLLPAPDEEAVAGNYSSWLGTTPARDAEQCAALLAGAAVHWLVVDHYALDAAWESALRAHCRQLLVIDDLANRAHDCDLLLDQNLGREAAAYAPLLPAHARCLTGPHHALLRPEFARHRDASLARRHAPSLRRLLVTMGGTDPDNITALVLDILSRCALPADSHVTVVMGATAAGLPRVRQLAPTLPWPCEVRVNETDMAGLNSACDLVIGAAGSSVWERCCLGVPSALAILADNQQRIAQALAQAGGCWYLGPPTDLADTLPAMLATATPGALTAMSRQAAQITDGQGTARVIAAMSHRHD